MVFTVSDVCGASPNQQALRTFCLLRAAFPPPDLPAQRHYEICRADFHDETPANEIAQRLHLHVGSVRAIVRDFARDPDVNAFFATARPGRKTSPKRDAIHQRACELRRQGATLADIRAALQREGFDVSESYLFRILRRAGLTTTRQGRPLRQPGDYYPGKDVSHAAAY